MFKSLLDLNDDILLHIAEYVNGDIDIPLPSFHPHWANFKHDITSQVNKDYLSLRLVCRRLKSIVPLRGLHMVFTDWEKLLKWNMNCPDRVRKGVQRIILDIKEKETSRHINSIMSTLVSFLRQLNSLEELVVIDLPLCRHDGDSMTLENLEPPSINYLPALKSLAFECACYRCSTQLPRLFIPAAPQLRHLKKCDEPDSKFCLESDLHQWKQRHSKEDEPPLYSLMITYLSAIDPVKILDDMYQDISTIRALYISEYDFSTRLWPLMTLGAKPSEKSKSDWIYKLFTYNADRPPLGFNLTRDDIDADWTADTTWPTFLNSLARFQHLQEFDFVLEFMLPAPIITSTPLHQETGSAYLSRRQHSRKQSISSLYPDVWVYSALQSAAKQMVCHAPNLQKGYFWKCISNCGPDGQRAHTWRRWTWNKNAAGTDVELENLLEDFPDDWTNNADGCQNIEY